MTANQVSGSKMSSFPRAARSAHGSRMQAAERAIRTHLESSHESAVAAATAIKAATTPAAKTADGRAVLHAAIECLVSDIADSSWGRLKPRPPDAAPLAGVA
jgi:hypothetical protein